MKNTACKDVTKKTCVAKTIRKSRKEKNNIKKDGKPKKNIIDAALSETINLRQDEEKSKRQRNVKCSKRRITEVITMLENALYMLTEDKKFEKPENMKDGTRMEMKKKVNC